MAKKLETAADRYRKDRSQKEELIDVTCTCDMVWKCRKEDLNFFINSGWMPSSLVEMVVAKGGSLKSEDEFVSGLDGQHIGRLIEFNSRVIRHTAVEPKIVEYPQEGKNELGFDEVMRCCYETIRAWQFSGGGSADRLANFR